MTHLSFNPLPSAEVASEPGYARWPALAASQEVVFVADGSLWLRRSDGQAWRLTSREAQAQHPHISPCARYVGYTARYDGPTEVYRLALAGGQPLRLSHEGLPTRVCGWHPDGRVLYASPCGAPLSRWRLFLADPCGGPTQALPLADASDGCFLDAQRLVFVRGGLHEDHVRHYRGGAMPTLWLVDLASNGEATPLFPAAAAQGACWAPRADAGRVYFLHERQGRVAVWSGQPGDDDGRRHGPAQALAVSACAVRDGLIVQACGGQLQSMSASEATSALPTYLRSDLPGLRPQILPQALRNLESVSLAADRALAVLRCRGRLWLLEGQAQDPTEIPLPGGRAGASALAADGASVYTVCDASGEPEIWQLPLNAGPARQLTHDGGRERIAIWPSPCGRWLAHADAAHHLWLLDLQRGLQRRLALNPGAGPVQGLVWLPGAVPSLVLCRPLDASDRPQLERWQLADDPAQDLCTRLSDSRFASYSPCISPDGQWLYYLCEREFSAPRSDPWGDRSFGVAFERRVRCDALALVDGATWAWDPAGESNAPGKLRPLPAGSRRSLPLPAANYRRLWSTPRHLLAWDVVPGAEPAVGTLCTLAYGAEAQVQRDERHYALVAQGAQHTQALVRLQGPNAPLQWRSVAANSSSEAVLRPSVDEGWSITVHPPTEWSRHLTDAWRHIREHMYDRQTHGVDWPAMGQRYAALLRRVTDRAEVDDVIGHMLAELSTLHTFVRPPASASTVPAAPAFLGGRTEPCTEGLRITHLYASDSTRPESQPPAKAPMAALQAGDTIVSAAGRPASQATSLGQLLAGTAGRRLALAVRGADGQAWRAWVQPVSAEAEQELRYADWALGLRQQVHQRYGGRISYLHLRAMRRADLESFVRDAYANPLQQAMVLDVRGNRGGNVESWIIEKLRREAWAWWTRPDAAPEPNMPGALRAHLAVLIDAQTYSDGETFAAAVRHFKLAPLIGTRTSGAGVWLAARPNLVDGGSVTVGQFGQFDAQHHQWLIEGQGVAPDLVVDNPPRAAFAGHDAQLDAALQWLQTRISEQPVQAPRHPAPPRLKHHLEGVA